MADHCVIPLDRAVLCLTCNCITQSTHDDLGTEQPEVGANSVNLSTDKERKIILSLAISGESMRRFVFFMACVLYGLSVVGCAKTTAVTQPPAAVAPGYLNATDQQMGEILSGARAFYVSIQKQSDAGTLVLTPTVKTAFNAFATTLNSAEAAYLSYHASPNVVTENTASQAVNQVQSQQAALPLPGAKP